MSDRHCSITECLTEKLFGEKVMVMIYQHKPSNFIEIFSQFCKPFFLMSPNILCKADYF